jgi:hypothetical protein
MDAKVKPLSKLFVTVAVPLVAMAPARFEARPRTMHRETGG